MASAAKKRSKGSKASVAKRKRRQSGSDEDEPAFLSSKYAEPPTSKIYNSRSSYKDPAELFRKDLISAMKLPDSEPLSLSDYWLIEDSWKPEWEKGVQVPVYPESLPEPHFRSLRKKSKDSHFKLPKKLIRFTRDSFFNPEVHVMSYTNTLAERTCRYDMDDIDLQWLKLVNEEREDFGLQPLEETFIEQIMEEFEVQSYLNFQESIKSEEGLGNQYDEDAVCDVCRSPDYQEDNEMVFCDSCNICVHQICYGITKIPEGSWICRTCALGIRPACVLCPNRGGAMKTTRCGQKWAHVGCAVWIPEVSFFNFVKMEPITKISQIPPSRWALSCSICKEKVGACIQCSEKNCKTAFHVTCAFKEGLQMRASLKHSISEDDVLLAFCKKHSQQRQLAANSSEENNCEGASSDKCDTLTSEERANLRQQRIEEKGAEFYNYVNLDDVAELFQHDKTDIEILYNYWKLKRRSYWNRALLPPKVDVDNACTEEENSTIAFLKKLVHHRQDLERVRNLCYMVTKREKLVKRWLHLKESIFLKQNETMKKLGKKMSEEEKEAVINANFGDMAYDKKYTGANRPSPNTASVLTALVGEKAVRTKLNGMVKSIGKSDRPKSERTPNPYAKHYLNGLLKRSQRWFASSVDKQCKVTKFRHSFDGEAHRNLSFQSSLDHTVSDDGFESSKDMHDVRMGRRSVDLCLSEPPETYHDSSGSVAKAGHSSNDFRFQDTFFYQSSNDSSFASPSKHSSMLEGFASDADNDLVFSPKSNAVENGVVPSGLDNSEQNSVKVRKKVQSVKKELQSSNKDIKTDFNNVLVKTEKIKEPEVEPEILNSTFNQNTEIKFNLDIPIENCIEVQSEENTGNDEGIIPGTEIAFADLKVQLEKSIDIHNDEKLNSSVQCVLVKSDIPLLSNGSENLSLKLTDSENSFKSLNSQDLVANADCDKNVSKKAVKSDTTPKDVKSRPTSNKVSQPSHSKIVENGVKSSKSHKRTPEKLNLSKPLKSKNVISSHLVSSPVNKHPSSPSSKCQEKSASKTESLGESNDSNKDCYRESPSYKGPVPRKDMLRGYKIPKKPRAEKVEESVTEPDKQPVAPSPPVPIATTVAVTTTTATPTPAVDSYPKGQTSWRKMEPRTVVANKPQVNMNGNLQQKPLDRLNSHQQSSERTRSMQQQHQPSSDRLVLKLKKDISDPETQRWKPDANHFNHRNNNMGGWVGEGGFTPMHPRPRRLHPPPIPPFLQHHPRRPWPRMRGRGGFRPIHMGYGGSPYT